MSKGGGGSWKVAYADFVTAMMALFLVLWLTAQDEKIKEAIERAFKNPFSSMTQSSTGVIPNKEISAVKNTNGNFESSSVIELAMLRRLNEDLLKKLENVFEDEDESVMRMDVSPDALRINVFDRSRRPVFEPDSSEFTPFGEWVFQTLAWVLARHDKFLIELEGHTEKTDQQDLRKYGKWEITADRANSARRKIIEHGVEEEQIFRVAGLSDTQPMPDFDPADESNRRVTVLLKVRS